jgi:hypothetical protein
VRLQGKWGENAVEDSTVSISLSSAAGLPRRCPSAVCMSSLVPRTSPTSQLSKKLVSSFHRKVASGVDIDIMYSMCVTQMLK